MLSNENTTNEDTQDDWDYDHAPIEPLVFLPPTASTLSINDPFLEDNSLDKPKCYTQFSGVMYTLLSSFLFTCAAFSIKQLGVDLIDALLLRFIVQTLLTWSYVRYKQYPFYFGTSTQIGLQFLYSATGAGGFFLYFIAIRYIELSDVSTICYTKVVWTVVFSILIYRERPSISSLIALPLTILGVIFVTQPSFLFSSGSPSSDNQLRLLGVSLSLCCSLTSATNVLTFKRLISTSKGIKPSVINFHYCVAVLILLIANQLYRKFILDSGLSFTYVISWRYVLASMICLIMIVVNILNQKAIKREHPAVFTLLGSADIIFALILQNIFTTKRSNLFALLGSALVIGSVVIIGIFKIIHEQPSEQKIKLMDAQKIREDFEEKQNKC